MHPAIRALPFLVFAAALALLSGCASYVPPGPKADLDVFASDKDIEKNFALRPAATFPATLAVVRAQGPRYSNHYLRHHGGAQGEGAYTLVTVREAGEQAQLDLLAGLPQVAGVTGINRLLVPAKLESDRELRAIASRLQADLILVYTFDTAFFDHNVAKPISVVSLGLAPTRQITAVTTVSALLIDTRSGYIHGTFEATESARHLSTSWGSADSADAARRSTERLAFTRLINDFTAAWPSISKPRPSAPLPADEPAAPATSTGV